MGVSQLLVFISITIHLVSAITLNGCCKSEYPCKSSSVESWVQITDSRSSIYVEYNLENRTPYCDEKSTKYLVNVKTYDHQIETTFLGVAEKSGEEVYVILAQDGTIDIHTVASEHNQQLPKVSYCIAKLNETWSQIEVCCTKQYPCYRKCCPLNQGLNEGFECVLQGDYNRSEWSPPIYREMKGSRELQTFVSSTDERKERLKPQIGFPNCTETYISTALKKLNSTRIPYVILADGTVKYLDPTDQKQEWKKKPEDSDYCVDSLILPIHLVDETCGSSEQDVLIACIGKSADFLSEDETILKKILRIVYLGGLILAMFFLCLTAMVHFLMKEKQNIHAWTIQCYVLSLFAFYFCLVIIYVDDIFERPLPYDWCVCLGVVTHFCGLCSFCWLSVINFDLWWTFRKLQPLSQKDFHGKRFTCYILFSVFLPIVITAISSGLHFSHKDQICRSIRTDTTKYPEYGKELCFLSNSAQLYYFYLPVGALLLVNLTFYIITSCKIFNLYKVSQRATSKKHKQSYQLFLKLFLVMGIAWIFQVVQALAKEKHSKWYWVLLDLVNLFQAFAIFCIFACKRGTLRSLEQHYPCIRGLCCHTRGLYRRPTLTDRSTEGSTRISRAEGLVLSGISEVQETEK